MLKLSSCDENFISAFTEVCLNAGYSEKQACDLFTAYANLESSTKSSEFKDGFNKELEKQAMQQFMRYAKPALGVAGLGGLMGATMPNGILPDDRNTGMGIGSVLGAGLGALSALKNPAHAFKSSPLNKMLVPGLASAANRGLGSLFSKNTAIGAGIGALGLGANSAGKEVRDYFGGGLQNPNPNLGVPWYLHPENNPSSGFSNNSSGQPNPFNLPADVMSQVGNPQVGNTQYGNGNADASQLANPLTAINYKKQELVSLNSNITQLESQLAQTTNNPNAYARRMATQAQIDNLKLQRNTIALDLGSLEKEIAQAKNNMRRLSTEGLDVANRGVHNLQSEYENLLARKNMETDNPMLGTLMSWYNQASGLEDRMKTLQPQYDAFTKARNNAMKVQELSNQ